MGASDRMNPAHQRPIAVSTRAVMAAALLLLAGGAVATFAGMETHLFDPMWGAASWGCGLCLALYGAARQGAARLKPAIEHASAVVERGMLISRRNALIAAQRRTEASVVQGRVDELTSRLYPKERERLTNPLPPTLNNTTKRTHKGTAR